MDNVSFGLGVQPFWFSWFILFCHVNQLVYFVLPCEIVKFFKILLFPALNRFGTAFGCNYFCLSSQMLSNLSCSFEMLLGRIRADIYACFESLGLCLPKLHHMAFTHPARLVSVSVKRVARLRCLDH